MGFSDTALIMTKLQAATQQANDHLKVRDPFVGRPGAFAMAVKAVWDINQAKKKNDGKVLEKLLMENEPSVETKLKKNEASELQLYLELSDAAYLESAPLKQMLVDNGYVLVRHEPGTEPGRVAHFLAFHPKRKEALVGLKGTSTVADCLTDVLSSSVKLEGVSQDAWFHEGIGEAAMKLASDLEDLIVHMFLPLKYNVVLTGHSLGAGTACILGIILRERIKDLHRHRHLHVYAFAPPPVVSKDMALSCTDFITSCVNNMDVIPRSSVANLVVGQQLLAAVEKKMGEEGKSATELPTEATHELWQKARDEVHNSEHFLHVPGQVVYFYRFGEDTHGLLKKTCELWTLRHIEITETMLNDHLTQSYRDALAIAAGTPFPGKCCPDYEQEAKGLAAKE